jgi:protein subunit release factor B
VKAGKLSDCQLSPKASKISFTERVTFLIMSIDKHESLRHLAPAAIERFPTNRASLERDCEQTFLIAGGPGGQNRNKVETGVRLVHRPTGITITATERRSQYANREVAFARMAERLQARQRPMKVRKATRPTAASHVRRMATKHHNALRKKLRTSPAGDD